ncbi:hypothetical protein KIN20_021139, partial [Parelaphostrongylus tenuis]
MPNDYGSRENKEQIFDNIGNPSWICDTRVPMSRMQAIRLLQTTQPTTSMVVHELTGGAAAHRRNGSSPAVRQLTGSASAHQRSVSSPAERQLTSGASAHQQSVNSPAVRQLTSGASAHQIVAALTRTK